MRRKLIIKTDETDIPFYCHPDETKEDPFQAHIIRGVTYQRIKGVSADNIVDVGANIGAASVFFALNYPEASIFSFEPVIKNYKLAKENTQHFKNIKIFNFGAYDENKRANIYLNQRNSGSHSIIRNWRGSDDKKSEKIRLINLGEFLPSLKVSIVDVLKIDTEGCELPILNSLSQFIPNIKVIYLEYHTSADKKKIITILGKTHYVAKDNLVGAINFPVKKNILGRICAKKVSLEKKVIIDRGEVVTSEKLEDLLRYNIESVLLFVNMMGELTLVNKNKKILF